MHASDMDAGQEDGPGSDAAMPDAPDRGEATARIFAGS
jgi:hypothetical protein